MRKTCVSTTLYPYPGHPRAYTGNPVGSGLQPTGHLRQGVIRGLGASSGVSQAGPKREPTRERRWQGLPDPWMSASWTAGGVRQDPQLLLSCHVSIHPEQGRCPRWGRA